MRVFRNILLGLLLLLGLAAVALVIWRKEALETAAQEWLENQGLGQAALTVAEVGFGHVVVNSADLGPGLPSAERILIRFEPFRLLAGEVEAVTVSGLRVSIDGEGQHLRERLDFLLSGGRASGRPSGISENRQTAMPSLTLRDAEMTLRNTPAGSGTLRVEGQVVPAPYTVSARLTATADLGHTTANLSLQTEGDGKEQAMVIDVSGQTDAAALETVGPLAAEAGGFLTGGTGFYNVTGRLTPPAGDLQEMIAWLRSPTRLRGRLTLDRLATSGGPETVSGELTWRLEGDGNKQVVTLTQPARLRVTGVDSAWLTAAYLDLPGDEPLLLTLNAAEPLLDWRLQDKGSGKLKVMLSAEAAMGEAAGTLIATAEAVHDAAFRLTRGELARLEATASRVRFNAPEASGMLVEGKLLTDGRLPLDGTLALRGTASGTVKDLAMGQGLAGKISVDTPFRLAGTFEALEIEADGLNLTAEEARAEGLLALTGPVTLEASTLAYRHGDVSTRFTISEGRATALAEAAAGPMAFSWERIVGDATVSLAGEIDGSITAESATAVAAGVQVSGVRARFPLTSGEVSLQGTARDTQKQRRFPPLSFSLSGERRAETVDLSGAVSAAAGKARIPVRLTADLVQQTAQVWYGPAPLTFAPGGLEPADLSPLLAMLDSASGSLTLRGSATLGPEQNLEANARATFKAFSANTDIAEVNGLNGEVRLVSVQPLATDGEQDLTADRVVAGVPLHDVQLRFAIPRGDERLVTNLTRLAGSLAGGKVSVDRTRLVNGAGELTVRFHEVSLERLLNEWQVQGVRATGKVSGTIPVRVGPDAVAVNNGGLAAESGGVIQVDFGGARSTLVGAGEEVELAVRALEDFHYQAMSIGIDKPPGGELTLTVGLEGSNPDVLDGHPFRFNINLSGRLEPILEAIRTGRAIGADLIRGGLGG